VWLADIHQVSSDALKAISNRTNSYTLLVSLLSANLDDYFSVAGTSCKHWLE
jgi:hypothetical protein